MRRHLLRVLRLVLVLVVLFAGTERLAAYRLNGYSWPSGTTVVMHLQLNRPQVPLQDGSGTWNNSATHALNIWNDHLSTVTFAAGPPTTSGAANGTNDVFFDSSVYGEPFGTNILAVTVRWSTGNTFTETDVIFNSARSWNSYRGPQQGSTFDLRRVALHEFGHALGLHHPDEIGQNVTAIMNSVISDLDIVADDDISGAQALYGWRITSSLTPPAVNSGAPFNYQITASNNPTAFTAAGLPPGLALNASTGQISGSCPISGTFNVAVTAQGAAGPPASGTVRITIDLLPLQSPTHLPEHPVGLPFSYQIRAANNPTQFAATTLPAGLQLDAGTGLISGVPTAPTDYARMVVRARGATSEAGGTVSFVISRPRITSGSSIPAVDIGDQISYTITATHPAAGFDATALPAFLTIDRNTGVISGTATAVGYFFFNVIARTAYGDATGSVFLEVRPPKVTSAGRVDGELSQSLTYQITATHNPTGYDALDLPPGLQIDRATGVISGAATTPGTYAVRIIAHTALGDATATITVVISRPRITSVGFASGTVGVPMAFQVSGSHFPTAFSGTGMPAGLTINAATGAIGGVPELSGDFTTEITASGIGGDAVGRLVIRIHPQLVTTAAVAKIPLQIHGPVLADPVRPRIYACTAAGLAVIDTTSLQVVTTVGLSLPDGVTATISRDGSRLWLTSIYFQSIKVLDLATLRFLPDVPTALAPTLIRHGLNGRLFVTSNRDPGVFEIDATTGATLQRFGPATPNYYLWCRFEISADGRSLYAVSNNEATMSKFDISNPGASPLVQRIEVPDRRSGWNIFINPNGQTAAFFNYQWPSTIVGPMVVRSADDLNVVRATYPTEWPGDFCFSPDGTWLVQGLAQLRQLRVYHTGSYSLHRTITMPPGAIVQQARFTLAVERSNERLFIATAGDDRALYVYDVVPPRGPPPPPHSLLNVSTRLRTGTADDVLIGGFIVTGNGEKRVILRAIGPSLPLGSTLADPTLELRRGDGTLVAANDNWNARRDEIVASGLPPDHERESAIIASLEPGNYTALLRGVAKTSGVALVELYDLNPQSTARIANISTRGKVETADNVMIGGFILGGDQPTSLIVRAPGPSLVQYGVPGALTDTTLDLHDGNGTLLASNDNWQSTQAAEIIATGFAPSDAREAAIVRTLAAGNYTAIVRGKNGAVGVALVEAFKLNNQ
jgi:hypothetical protein